MGKGINGIKKQRKQKLNGEIQNYGKVGRPKKKKEANDIQEIDKDQWFNVTRALHMLTLICEKGSLALRYKTGQRSTTIDDQTKFKKCEETRKLKQKLRDLKKNCGYDEKKLYLLIDNNTEKTTLQIELPDADGLIEDMNKIYKYLDKEFQKTFDLIVSTYLQEREKSDEELVQIIIEKIIQSNEHQMILNLALIKTNIEDDLDYVLQLVNLSINQANTQPGTSIPYEVNEQWEKSEEKIHLWLITFITKILSIFKLQ